MKRNIQTNHELPLQMLEEYNISINDYDFVLFHLYLNNEEYRNYFLNIRQKYPERLMMLDNSAYEFYITNTDFDYDSYFRVIIELQPNYYIIPDVLMDKDKTLDRFKFWFSSQGYFNRIKDINPNIHMMIVPQGKTLKEWVDCYEEMKQIVPPSTRMSTRMSIPFHNDFFKELGSKRDNEVEIICKTLFGLNCNNPHLINDDETYAVGRCVFVNLLAEMRIKDSCYLLDNIHLLGTHNPVELRYISQFNFISTFDTGYPVKLAMNGVKLGFESYKPDLIIDDFFTYDLNDDTFQLILNNIGILREKYIKTEEYAGE